MLFIIVALFTAAFFINALDLPAESMDISIDEIRSIADFLDGDLAEEFVHMQEAFL
ncbi:hypothetical protein [Aliidiomarina minuta]|uniref:hypothetical protein n=1 Tax=Aliidiomarina minuta TaxID=880057 RepID=UPI001300869A|nr:hypothetical protein [Aliidiomarina minuta]